MSTQQVPERNDYGEHVPLGGGLEYEQLSQEAVYQAKRFLLDSVGCALGGYQQHDVMIALGVLKEIAGRGPATVIGTGKKMDRGFGVAGECADDPLHGLQRHLLEAGSVASVGYFSGGDGVLRAGEERWQGIDCWICAGPRVRNAAVRGGVSGDSRARMASCDADGVCVADCGGTRAAFELGTDSACDRNFGFAHCTMGAVTAGKLTMMKNTVDPMATQSGVLAALLAEKGYSGPEHVIDGKEGLVHCFGPEWKLNLLTDGLGESWRITQCGMKFFPTEALTHAPISAVLDLVKRTICIRSKSRKFRFGRWRARRTFFPIRASTIHVRRKRRTIRCPM